MVNPNAAVEELSQEEQDEKDAMFADLDDWYDEDPEIEDEDEDPSAEEDEEDEGTSDPDDDSDPEPDPKVQTEDAPKGASEDGNSAKTKELEDDPFAWVETLDPKYREKVERLVHSDQSQRGRVAALQRRLDSAIAQQEAAGKSQPTAAAKKAVADGKPLEDMNDEELESFMKDFPSVARNVEKILERRLAKEREELLGEIRPLKQEAEAQQIRESREALRKEATVIFNTAETGIELDDVLESRAFHDWFASQPPGYQKFARTAESLDDAARVLEDFARFTDEQVGQQAKKEQERAAQEKAEARRRSADRTASRRKEALQGTGVPSRSAEIDAKRTGSSYEDDFESFL